MRKLKANDAEILRLKEPLILRGCAPGKCALPDHQKRLCPHICGRLFSDLHISNCVDPAEKWGSTRYAVVGACGFCGAGGVFAAREIVAEEIPVGKYGVYICPSCRRVAHVF